MKNDGDKFEQMTIEQLGLKPFGSGKRSNKYIHDAELDGYKFELKSCSGKTGKISTARGVSHKKIDSWRDVHWVVSVRDNGEIIEHILVNKDKMDQHIYKGLEQKIEDPGKNSKFAGTSVIPKLNETLAKAGYNKTEIEKIRNTLERGTRLNDPRLNLDKIRAIGTVVSSKEELLRELKKQ